MYDLQADPYELTNLIGFESHADVTKQMRQRLIRRMVQAGESGPVIQSSAPKQSGQRRVSSEEVWD